MASCLPLTPLVFLPSAKHTIFHRKIFGINGGGTGIRTLDGLAPMPVFKTGAFNRSAIPPNKRLRFKKLAGKLINPFLSVKRFSAIQL